MSKIAEQKAKDIAKKLEASQSYNFDKFSVVCGAIEGYDQAMQDFLEKAERWLSQQPMSRPVFWTVQDFKNYMEEEL